MPGGNYGTEIFVAERYGAFTTSALAIKATPGKCCRIIVTSAVTGTVTINDSTAGGGTNVFVSGTNPAAGSIFDVMIPCATGIWCIPGSAGAGIVTFT